MTKIYPVKVFSLAWILVGAVLLSPISGWAANSAQDQKTIEELKKTYPLKTCPVSGEALNGAMGAPVDYLYTSKKDGKETVRLVRFCCGGCPRVFLKDPDKYLKVIDDASKDARKGQ